MLSVMITIIICSWCETKTPMFTRLKDFIKAWQCTLQNVKIALLQFHSSHTHKQRNKRKKQTNTAVRYQFSCQYYNNTCCRSAFADTISMSRNVSLVPRRCPAWSNALQLGALTINAYMNNLDYGRINRKAYSSTPPLQPSGAPGLRVKTLCTKPQK